MAYLTDVAGGRTGCPAAERAGRIDRAVPWSRCSSIRSVRVKCSRQYSCTAETGSICGGGRGMSRQEYVSPEGLRLDGRRPGEVRRVRCSLGVLARADGSAMYEQGNTRVIAAVYGPREVTNRMDALPDRAIINAELSNASFSASERKGKLKNDRRANELALLVKEAFEAAIIVQLFPNSQIDIFLQIMQVDGGVRGCFARNTIVKVSCG